MLLKMNAHWLEEGLPSELLLQNIWASCAAQQSADLEYQTISFIEILNRGRHPALGKWRLPRHAGRTHAYSLAV